MTEEAKRLRIKTLEISCAGRDGNLMSCFSSADIISALFSSVINPLDRSPNRNQFVLSKGQSNMALMAQLVLCGAIPEEEIQTACRLDARISMQADRTKFDCVENSAGSLGHGLPIAAGMAWAKKIKGYHGKVFVLVGDGEMNEGTMWEALLFAASEKLDNLVIIIDNNHSLDEMLNIGSFKEKMEAFGMQYISGNGHDAEWLVNAIKLHHEKPLVIDAQTVRGWGSETMLADRFWFHRAPNAEQLKMLSEEVLRFDESQYKREEGVK